MTTQSDIFPLQKLSWLAGTRCLLTGGAGFIGSNIAEKLLALGAEVTVLDDFSTGNKANLSDSRLQIIEGSITDPDLLRQHMPGKDYVFHLAAIPAVPRSIELPLETAWVNVWGTQLVLDSARQAGVKRVVYSASSSAYGGTPGETARTEDMIPQPLSPYASQKLSGEYLARAYALTQGLDTISLRYFNIFGPKQSPTSAYAAVIPKFIRLALAGKTIPVNGTGEQKRDFTYIDNAVYANLLATRPNIKTSGAVINVGCGDTFSLKDLIAGIESLAGKKLEVEYNPPRAGDVFFSRAEIGKARELIGYEPIVNFQSGLQRLYHHLRTIEQI